MSAAVAIVGGLPERSRPRGRLDYSCRLALRFTAATVRVRLPRWWARATSSARLPTRRARPDPPRLPLRGLARHRKDFYGKDPRRLPELRGRSDDHSLRVCESCRSIATATSLDVVEMDAASRTRSTTSARCASPSRSPAVGPPQDLHPRRGHMLSTAAWNAFLKTLEEPPPNTVFVLATTDAQRVPATVIDRCHRFDFGRPSTEQIATVLRRAATAESISVLRTRSVCWPPRRRELSRCARRPRAARDLQRRRDHPRRRPCGPRNLGLRAALPGSRRDRGRRPAGDAPSGGRRDRLRHRPGGLHARARSARARPAHRPDPGRHPPS